MPPKGAKKRKEAAGSREISKKQQRNDNMEFESPSGSDESYEIYSSGTVVGPRIVEGVVDESEQVDASTHAIQTTHTLATPSNDSPTSIFTTSIKISPSIHTGYVVDPKEDMRRMAKRLTISERKIDVRLEQVKLWVKKEMEKTAKGLNMRLDGFEVHLNHF
ncbi:hypothetical protein HAX54_048776 [Datura stramonium]|uniref:Uncharacterized protein n=1 Tax=Datura stramonium TaxID=4076 RepID=A0ABS8SUN0_DATST|nr:hypothetical protein [Datura stramonium]